MSYKSNKLAAQLINKYTKWVDKNMYVKSRGQKRVYLPFDNNAKALEKIIQNRKIMASGQNAYDMHPKKKTYAFSGMSEQSYFASYGA